MSSHDGARERLKERFWRGGLDGFPDVHVLELLLTFAIPRRETNTIAHALLEHFGSLSAVFEASREELEQVKGVGENAAALIKLIPAMDRRYHISRAGEVQKIMSSDDAGRLLIPRYRHAREEIVYLITLDGKRELIACEEIGRGTLDEAHVSIRTIAETALRRNAASVILSHNHVDGIALPSRADAQTTETIRQALRYVGITLSDHIIVAGDDYVSFADSGLLGMPFTG